MNKNINIFIVEDEPIIAAMLEDHLGKNPLYTVRIFETGEACLENMHLKPDIIILDLILNTVVPDARDGLHILNQIKNINKTVHVIVLSSQSDREKIIQSKVKGAIEYIVKDVNAFGKIDFILSIVQTIHDLAGKRQKI